MSIEKKVRGGILEGWELVAKVEVTTNSTSISINGLDGDADGIYLIIFLYVNPLGVDTAVSLYPNNTTTGHTRQYLQGNGTTFSAGRTAGNSHLAYAPPGEECLSVAYYYPKTGERRRWTLQWAAATTIYELLGAFDWSDTTTPIESMYFTASQTNGIGAKSKLFLFKLAKHQAKGIKEGFERVTEIDVPANTTSVSLLGLNGDADEVYLLKGLIKNVSLEASYDFQPNGLTTNLSYQRVRADGTGYIANRNTTVCTLLYLGTGAQGFFQTILYAKTGVQRRLVTHNSYDVTPGTVCEALWAGLWNDSTTKITSIEIKATSADQIGSGSKIILYKKRN